MHEHLVESKAIHNWIEDQGGWCLDCPEFWFVTGIEIYGHVVLRVYCCDLADFGEVAEGPFASIVLSESLEDRQYPEVVVFWGVLL